MSTNKRIALVADDGEELFSGESVLSEPPPTDDEPIPETLRSSVLARALEPVSRPIIVDEAPPPKGTGNRAA